MTRNDFRDSDTSDRDGMNEFRVNESNWGIPGVNRRQFWAIRAGPGHAALGFTNATARMAVDID